MALRHKHRAVIASFEMRVTPYVRDVLREHFCATEMTEHDARAEARSG